MKLIKSIASKLTIRLSFVIASITIIALGEIGQFFLLLFAVLLHELSHVMAAALFHLQTEKIIFTPLGLTAVIKKMESAPPIKRAAILMAGPSMSLFAYYISSLFFPPWRHIHLAVFLLNILPVYPLDGGKLLQQLLGNTAGILLGNRLLISLSRAFSYLLIFLGILQTILFPYNVSLLCIGVYIGKACEQEYLHMTYSAFQSLFAKADARNGHCYNARVLIVHAGSPVKLIVQRFFRDYYHIVQVIEGHKIIYTLSESEFTRYIMANGLQGTASDVYAHSQ